MWRRRKQKLGKSSYYIFSVAPSTYIFNAAVETYQFDIESTFVSEDGESSAATYSAISMPSWVTVDGGSVTVAENTSATSDRTGSIVWMQDISGREVIVDITQREAGLTYAFVASPASRNFGSGGESSSVTITSTVKIGSGEATNIGYTLVSKPSWITASDNSGSFSVSSNGSTSSRSGTIVWMQDDSGNQISVSISQSGSSVTRYYTVSSNCIGGSVYFNSTYRGAIGSNGTLSVSIVNGGSYTVKIAGGLPATDNIYDLSISPTSYSVGSGGGNTGSGSITSKVTTTTYSSPPDQTITTTNNSITMDYASSSSISWQSITMTSSPSWVSDYTVVASGATGTIYFTAGSNTTPSSRSGTITISQTASGGKSINLSISQTAGAATVNVSANQVSCTPVTGSPIGSATYKVSWTVNGTITSGVGYRLGLSGDGGDTWTYIDGTTTTTSGSRNHTFYTVPGSCNDVVSTIYKT